MLTLPRSLRILVAVEPVDFRKAFDGLCGIIRDSFRDDPVSGDVFVFFNKARDRVKLLVWDANGFWLHYKRLERGRFEALPPSMSSGQRVEIDRGRLSLLLEGLEFRNSRYRRHFNSPILLVGRSRRVDESRRTTRQGADARSSAR